MELVRIFTTQRIEDPEVRVDDLIDVLFHQESPKGSAEERVGDDALVPGRKRVWRADPAFQNYRIAAQLSNVRVTVPSASGGSTTRRLTVAEREAAYTLLSTWTTKARPTWARVSDALDLTPGALRAPTDRPDDGEDLTGAPCVNTTHQVLWNLPKELGALRDWYRAATPDARTAMVYHLFSNVETAQDYPTIAELDDLVAGLDSDALASLDDVRLGDLRRPHRADHLDGRRPLRRAHPPVQHPCRLGTPGRRAHRADRKRRRGPFAAAGQPDALRPGIPVRRPPVHHRGERPGRFDHGRYGTEAGL
jgi:CRISPR-associated endonuclease Csn1